MASNLKDITDVLSRLKELSKKTFDGMNTKQIKAAREELKKLEAELKKVKNTTSDVGEEFDELKDGLGHLGKMASAPASGMRNAAKGASAWADRIKQTNSLASEFGVKLGIAGKVAGKLGVAVGGISKVLLGWPGLVIMGVKALVDGVTKIDSYIKNMNKNFAAIRGPEIMTKDVNRQFKDFNLAITSISDNLRDGLRSAEVYEFMTSIAQAGVKLTELNKGFNSYRGAVNIAAKASKNLSLSIVEVGAMMGDMMTNYRMDLKQMDKAFVQVAFDAEKSGLSTDRFWTSVKNASASLAFYGKFIKDVSNATRVFTKSQVQGADESISTVQELTQAFGKSATQTNMAIVEIAKKSGANFGEIFGGIREKVLEEAKGISTEITLLQQKETKTPADVQAIEDLKIKLVNANRRSERLQKAQHADTVTQAQELAMATGEAPGIIMDVLGGITKLNFTTDEYGEKFEAIMRGVEGVTKGAIKGEVVKSLLENAKVQSNRLLMSTKGIQKFEKGQTEQIDQSEKFREGLNNLTEKTPKDEIDKMAKEMSKLYSISEEDARYMLNAASVDKVMLDKTQKLLASTETQEANLDKAKDIYKATVGGQDMAKKLFKKELNERSSEAKSTQDAYDDTFNKIRDNTLSIEDMKNIVSDGAKYQLASLARLTDISTGISKLVVGLVGGKESGTNPATALSPFIQKREEAKNKIEQLNQLKDSNKITEESYRLQMESATKDYKNADDMITKLESVDTSSQQTSILMAASVAGNKDAKQALFKIAKEKYLKELKGGQIPMSAIKKDFGGPMADIIKEQAASYDALIKNPILRRTEVDFSKVNFPESTPVSTESAGPGKKKQGLQNPETVTHAGAVVLHPKETILPASYSGFQTKPMMMGGESSTTPAGAGVGKTIQINVTATEKDLAQRIANEVRSVLYKEQVNNLG